MAEFSGYKTIMRNEDLIRIFGAHHMQRKLIARLLLACLYLTAGTLHLVNPAPFLKITPNWVLAAPLVITLTGIAEIVGALSLVQPRWRGLRVAAGWALAAYALSVWPANINHLLMDMARPDLGLGWVYHGPRMLAQPVLI